MKNITTVILAAGKSTRFVSSKSKLTHDLAGLPIEGYLSAKKSGHYLNNQLLRKLLSDKSNFEII